MYISSPDDIERSLRIKIGGIMILPVLILGIVLNYWVRTGLSDWLSYFLDATRVEAAMSAGSRSVMLVTSIAAILSMLLTFLLMLILTKPLLELREVAGQVMEGELSKRARLWSRDEIGEVGRSVNLMIDRLVTNQKILERTNHRLEAINQVAMAAGRELDLQDILDTSLSTTLDVMDLTSGWVFLLDQNKPGDLQFTLASHVNLDEPSRSALMTRQKEFCNCIQDLTSGKVDYTSGAFLCHHSHSEIDSGDFQNGHITIPLGAGGRLFGTMNLLSVNPTEPSQDDIELLTTIGVQVSEFVDNAWLNINLLEKEITRQTLLEALVRAQEDERSRLARRLHDGAGQSLTSLLVRLKTLEKKVGSKDYRHEVSSLCNMVSETIEQIGGIAYQLRPAMLEEFGLEVALRTLAHDMLDDAGLEVEYQLDLNGKRLPFEVETSLYRIIQESLTNVIRHANAKQVLIELSTPPNAVRLIVEDNGIGFDPTSTPVSDPQRHLGLVSMQERAEMMGGTFEVVTTPGNGVSIQVKIPLQVDWN
jgi:signal transduction histidine kinase